MFCLNFLYCLETWDIILILVTGHEEMINSKMWKGVGHWACTDCEFTSKNKSNVFEHIEGKHIQGPGYICPECEKICPTKKALRHHLARHHPKPKVASY